jgi:hypothetical protein
MPHIFLYNQLTDGGEVVSLKRRPPFTTRNIPGTHFCPEIVGFLTSHTISSPLYPDVCVTHPASFPIDTGGFILGGKAAEAWS